MTNEAKPRMRSRCGVRSAAAPAVQHVLGTSMQTAVAEFKAWKGDDKALFAKFCKDLVKDAAGNPKPSKEYGVGDWATVVNAIRDAVAKTVAGGAYLPHTTRPDLDNLEKGLLDTMTRLRFWLDDSQVAQKKTNKAWGESPFLEIHVREIAAK